MEKISLCPDLEVLAQYKEALAEGKSRDEMSADQAWVDFHVDECPECKKYVSD